MIHHLFTLHRPGSPVVEKLAVIPNHAISEYARDIYSAPSYQQLTVAVWKDRQWLGYYKVTLTPSIDRVEPITTPECFEPLPCPKPTPAATAPAFASCAKADQEVAFMALERRIRELGAEAEDYRGAGNDAMADVLTGHQAACAAALKVLREVAQ